MIFIFFLNNLNKKNMLKKVLTVTGAMAILSAAHSQDSTKGTTTMTYSVDAYTRYDFAGKGNNYTSFTNSTNSFELGMASIRADHSFGKVSATLDLGFGKRAADISYNDINTSSTYSEGPSLAAIKQAFIAYQATSKVKFTLGKWATPIGQEVFDAYANRNYSMSYGFTYDPLFHTGLRADFTLGAKSGLMVAVANPTDFSTGITGTFNYSGNKMAVAQFFTGTKNDKVKGFLNFQGGPDSAGTKITQFDLVLNFVLSSKWGLNYDGTIKSMKPVGGSAKSWSSNAFYLNYDPTSKLGWTLRAEYFDDTKGATLYQPGATVFGSSVFATTLSANIHLSNLTIIPELRMDDAKDNIFAKSDGTPAKSATSFILAATYKF